MLPTKYIPNNAPNDPKIKTKSNDASLIRPFVKATKGIVINWILHKNKGNSYNQLNASFDLKHIIIILIISKKIN